MKILIPILIISAFSFGQQTYVPDDNFEAYLEMNGMGNGIPNDDSVTTANIIGVGGLYMTGLNIADLTGIEDFSFLQVLACGNNMLTSIDLSQNTQLTDLACGNNPISNLDVSSLTNLTQLRCGDMNLTSLDVTQNSDLVMLHCNNNQLTSLDITQNPLLTSLWCHNNSISTIDFSANQDLGFIRCYSNSLIGLDLSQNPSLAWLECDTNQLSCLNLKNGNSPFSYMTASSNPNLTCIDVDNVALATSSWTVAGGNIDPQMWFSLNCGNSCSLSLGSIPKTQKSVIKIIDLMGRETEYKSNVPLIYIYSDGTREKFFKVE